MSGGQPPDAGQNNDKMAAKAIRAEIKRILDSWDPLSLKGLRGFHTEYNDHVGPLYVLVRKGAEPMEIARAVLALAAQFGLPDKPDDREKYMRIAEKIHRTGHILPRG